MQYTFRGKPYQDSGEFRAPRLGEVYFSHLLGEPMCANDWFKPDIKGHFRRILVPVPISDISVEAPKPKPFTLRIKGVVVSVNREELEDLIHKGQEALLSVGSA